jgi:hypothetical protein
MRQGAVSTSACGTPPTKRTCRFEPFICHDPLQLFAVPSLRRHRHLADDAELDLAHPALPNQNRNSPNRYFVRLLGDSRAIESRTFLFVDGQFGAAKPQRVDAMGPWA